MVELGKKEDLEKRINDILLMINEEKNDSPRLALCNYLGTLYSVLNVVSEKKVYPDKSKIFGNLDNYRYFMKETDCLLDKFISNYIENKDFHQEYLNDVLIDTESILVENAYGKDYSSQSDYFGKKDFYSIFHDFCSRFGIDKIYDEIVNEKRIFSMKKGKDFDNYSGLTFHNPLVNDSGILVDSFDYNLDSLFILAHEAGHYYDLEEFASYEKVEEYNSYAFKSIYQECISRLFERLLLKYLYDNNIMKGKVIDKIIDMEIINHDYIISAYLLSLLDDKYIEKERYRELSVSKFAGMIGEYFNSEETVLDFMKHRELDLNGDINYAYGDIVSIFLEEEVINEGLKGPLMRKFRDIRCREFNEEFFLKNGLSPNKYIKLYEKEIQLIKK